jgi:hypothetical protein
MSTSDTTTTAPVPTPAPDPVTSTDGPRAHDVVYMCPCGNLLPVPSMITVQGTAQFLCTLHEPPVQMRRYTLTEG